MRHLAVLLATGLACTGCLAETPQQQFDARAAAAAQLHDQKAYAAAAGVLEKMADTPASTGFTEWPDRLYDLACNHALAGKPEAALAALEKATALGAMVNAEDVEKNDDFATLRTEPRFKAVVERLKQRARLWQDNPALATPYKPVLSEEEKVAGLSKIWAEARFNFPFFDRIPDLDWDGAYMAYLPKVRAANSTEAYYDVLMRFSALLKDGHTRVLPPSELMGRFNGITAVATRMVEGRILVTGVADPALEAQGIGIGAEVVRIDGKPALAYADTVVAPYVSAFTTQDRAIWQYGFQLLRGPVGKPVSLTVKNADGKLFTAAVPRFHNDGPFGILPKLDKTADFKMLPGNIAYLQINWFVDDAGLKTLKENWAAATAADGLIIDIRENGGGNDDNSLALVRVLADKPFQGSIWRTADYKAAYRSWNRPQGFMRSSAPTFQPDPELHYGKPMVVLISGRTYSAAEDFLVAYISSGRGKLIGETSGGSTGNPMLMKLPGGGMAFICTKDDSFADGRVFEGVGIAPDIAVSPSVADIRSGRDAAIEKAVAVLKQTR